MLTSPFSSHGDRRVAVKVFGSALTAPRRARAFVRCQLGRWELANLADTAELLVSELVTNAVHATNEVRNAPIASSMFPVAMRMVALRLRVSSGPRSLFIDGRCRHAASAARPARVAAAISRRKGPAVGADDAHRVLPRRVRQHPQAERAAGPDEMGGRPSKPERGNGAGPRWFDHGSVNCVMLDCCGPLRCVGPGSTRFAKGFASDVDRAHRLSAVQEATSARVLHVFFTPTAEEIAWSRERTKSPEAWFAQVLDLKCFQKMARFCALEEIPEVVVDHVRRCLELGADVVPDHGAARTAKLHRKQVRARQGVKYDKVRARAIAAAAIRKTAEKKNHPPDLINIALEKLVEASGAAGVLDAG